MRTPIEVIQEKSKLKTEINMSMLSVAFLLFTFIATIEPDLIRHNAFLSLQLTLSIPLFCTSIFARSRLQHSKQARIWDHYGYITYILAYSFLVNVIGILLSTIVSVHIGLIFWAVNIVSAIVYSLMEIREDGTRFQLRCIKDSTFALILIAFGILPALGIW